MSVFGWSYPPGCSGPPDDDCDETCAVCGASDIDRCVCRTCRTCGEAGDPQCYHEWHNPKYHALRTYRGAKWGHTPSMHMTAEQWRKRAQADEQARQQAEREQEWCKIELAAMERAEMVEP